MLLQARDEFNAWSFGAGAGIYLAGFRSLTQVERGDLAAARETIAAIVDPPEDDADGTRYFDNGRLALAAADGTAPERLVELADAHAARHARVLNPAYSPWREVKVEALARLGRREEALALAEENLALARRWGAPGTVGAALRALATASEGEAALSHLEAAVAVLEGSTARLEHAKALAALGRRCGAARRPSEAREPLQRALELAAVCGAGRVGEAAREELAASGARPRRDGALRGRGADPERGTGRRAWPPRG